MWDWQGFGSRATRVASLAFCVTWAGCAAPQTSTPKSTVKAYAEAVEDGRLEEAYALLSDETRQDLSFPEFATLIESNPEEVAALIHALDGPSRGARVTATFTTKDGEELELVYEDGAWRIQESAVDLWPQNTPRQALKTFVRAFDAKRYDVLMKFVPDDKKGALSPELLKTAWEGEQKLEMERITEGLRASVDQNEIEELGDRATMSYGAGGTVELLLEGGLWKIEDFR